MVKILQLVFYVLIIGFALGCASNSGVNNEQPVLNITACEDPRPQICTREYNPVCGVLKDGSLKTGSTGCTSCSNPDVVGYTMGACQ